jgi:DNA-directed RNA polymerase subunit omega
VTAIKIQWWRCAKSPREGVIGTLQRVQIDDDDAVDEMASLAQAADALRLTAAAPPRNQNLGSDYE